ncbi:MAG: alpha/beta fold hydrolase [Pseudomonadales bacterium]|jgi:hypothetical protein
MAVRCCPDPGVMPPHYPFVPARLLRSPHAQTILGSRGRGRWVRARAARLLAASRREEISVDHGVRLEAWIASQPEPAPAVILLHGWLGHAGSTYVLSAAAELWQAGFSVVRLNLPDHGDTAHLNSDLFHSARIVEVTSAVHRLVNDHLHAPTGLAGYSLGGNFALRIARDLGIETLAVCPALDPAATVARIDSGLAAYRWFFTLKWRRALSRKEKAFPDRYDFAPAGRLATVGALTEWFVREHTEFPDADAYFRSYTLTGDALAGTRASVLYAEDDPVIPAAGFETLPRAIERLATDFGGHCAFIEQFSGPTWSDRYLVRHFRARLDR